MNALISSSRRRFLARCASGIVLVGGLPHRPGLRAEDVSADESPTRLLVRQEKPFNAEPAEERLLDHWITDPGTFFRRNHGTIPKIDPATYRFTVEGLVERPLTLTLDELKERFPAATATATLTCAGNRRTEFPQPNQISGVMWHAAAIGTGEWRGVNLADVLKAAGLKPEAKHVWFEGQDEVVEGGKTISFGASIPLEKGMTGTRFTPGALLVHTMNGQPLPQAHGAPLRTIVPGYIGARSVKWLGKIVVSDRPSPNYFVSTAYKVLTEGTEAEIQAVSPIYEYVVNSVICQSLVADSGSRVVLKGYALPSGGPGCLIQRVEVSLDDGRTWSSARLTSPQREFCWAFWEAVLPEAARGKTALVRAIDTCGATQPRKTPLNLKGYQYNGWHGVMLPG